MKLSLLIFSVFTSVKTVNAVLVGYNICVGLEGPKDNEGEDDRDDRPIQDDDFPWADDYWYNFTDDYYIDDFTDDFNDDFTYDDDFFDDTYFTDDFTDDSTDDFTDDFTDDYTDDYTDDDTFIDDNIDGYTDDRQVMDDGLIQDNNNTDDDNADDDFIDYLDDDVPDFFQPPPPNDEYHLNSTGDKDSPFPTDNEWPGPKDDDGLADFGAMDHQNDHQYEACSLCLQVTEVKKKATLEVAKCASDKDNQIFWHDKHFKYYVGPNICAVKHYNTGEKEDFKDGCDYNKWCLTFSKDKVTKQLLPSVTKCNKAKKFMWLESGSIVPFDKKAYKTAFTVEGMLIDPGYIQGNIQRKIILSEYRFELDDIQSQLFHRDWIDRVPGTLGPRAM